MNIYGIRSKRGVAASLAVLLVLSLGSWACGNRENVDPQMIREKYGITQIATDRVVTPEGSYQATVVPVMLADGQRAQLVIPQERRTDYPLYLRDETGVAPVVVENRSVSREQFVRSRPVLVERRVAAVPERKKKRSWEKEVLIVAGSAGAGAAVGGLAGGKKGAGIGALTGGVAGLVYDLATRDK